MSIIRRYGSAIINLSRVTAVIKRSETAIHFVYPQSNWFTGGYWWQSDASETHTVSVPDAEEELRNIEQTLQRFYEHKKH